MGKKVVRALKRKDDGISHSCIDFLCALMQPMHDNYDLRQEQMNKSSLLSNKQFLEMLLEPLKMHVVSGEVVSGERGEVVSGESVEWGECEGGESGKVVSGESVEVVSGEVGRG